MNKIKNVLIGKKNWLWWTALKRLIEKTEKAIGDLTGNKIVDKMTDVSSQNVPGTNLTNGLNITSQT